MKNVMQYFLSLAVLTATGCASAKTAGTTYYFGQGTPPKKAVSVDAQQAYSDENGCGWLRGQPNLFAVQLPEGNYNVSVAFSDAKTAAAATVKAEARRVMLRSQERPDAAVRRFTVNIRRPDIDGGERVKLNSRETGPTMIGHWDDLLTLEFLPGADGVVAVNIEPVDDAVTVYIAGDSTVTDQRFEPWTGWGQVLPSFFEPGVAVANHSESGRALFSFLWEKRLDKIISTLEPGDYLFIQFGHNDQKDKREGSGPFTTYTQELEGYISKVRKKDANPVLVTPMERRRWKSGQPQETLTDYAEAMRRVAKKEDVPLIDLHAMSLELYAALGPDDSAGAFVHYPANTFPDQPNALKDDTHHNVYGAYELARCVIEGMKTEVPKLAKHLRNDVGSFDPSKPDDPEQLGIAASLSAGAETPEGN